MKYGDGPGINSCSGNCYLDNDNVCKAKRKHLFNEALLSELVIFLFTNPKLQNSINTFQLVLVDIKVRTRSDAHLLKWTLGACSSSKEYTNNKEFVENNCFLEPGMHILSCSNTKQPYGWKNGFITINEHRYCDDFMGYKALRHVFIGNKCITSIDI